MDRLSRAEIEDALGRLLPGSTVKCVLWGDDTASLTVTGETGESFAVVGLVRSDYRGEAGLKSLAKHIFEDIQLARQGLKTHRAKPLGNIGNQSSTTVVVQSKARH
jgi:hypothetical protein